MSIVTSSAFGKALWPGINAWYQQAYSEYPVEYTALFDTFKMSKAFEEDVGYAGLGLAKETGEGEPVQYEGHRQGFITRYTPQQFTLGFIITEIAMEDDLYNVVGEKKAKGLAFSMRQTKEIVGANVYNRAFNGSYVGGDGVSLCNASHPLIKGGTLSNTTATDLSETALEQACINISKWTDEAGMKIAVMPRTLIIPVDLQFEAHRILDSDLRVATADNDTNALKDMGMFPGGIVVNHYFTDTNAWFIRNQVQDGLKYWERRADTFKMEDDFDTSNAKFKATARYAFGWTDWRSIYGSSGA